MIWKLPFVAGLQLALFSVSKSTQFGRNYSKLRQDMVKVLQNQPLARAGRMRKNTSEMLTAAQIRAGRALLKWSATQLSERSGVSYAAIQRAEAGEGLPHMQVRNLAAIKRALEEGGVVFIDDNTHGPGVRLKK
jgi:ribosome-binding protein aMBF1 (putative translation factor)